MCTLFLISLYILYIIMWNPFQSKYIYNVNAKHAMIAYLCVCDIFFISWLIVPTVSSPSIIDKPYLWINYIMQNDVWAFHIYTPLLLYILSEKFFMVSHTTHALEELSPLYIERECTFHFHFHRRALCTTTCSSL